MSSFHDIKAAARTQLHEHMARAANLYPGGGVVPYAITARYHDESKPVGDLAGTNLSYAEQQERPAQIVFWNSELDTAGVDLDRGDEVIFSSSEGYHVEVVHPRDGLTTKADVTPLRPGELSGKEAPGGTVTL